jgi:uracil-DNA glycosylase
MAVGDSVPEAFQFDFDRLMHDARACRVCEPLLPLGARPIFQAHSRARILIASQAPGRIAHRSGIPFQDPSGRRLRDWLDIDEAVFYDPEQVAILPMGLCYPGRGTRGDRAPRPECAPMWREAFLQHMNAVRLVLLIGRHAQRWHLGRTRGSVAFLARSWLEAPGPVIPLPHPSPRNNAWLCRHAWFENSMLPVIRERLAMALET